MKRLQLSITMFIVLLYSFQLLAGPNTNFAEIEGDAHLSKEQQAEYSQRLDQGLAYFDKGEYENAEKEFNTILTFAPKKPLAYFNLGLTKYKMKDYQAAIQNFDKVIKMKSYYVGAALYYRAISQLNLGDVEGATQTANRYTENHFYYDLSQELLKTIKSGTDEYLTNAQAAYVEGNFELCLLELEMSVLADTAKGVDLSGKCKAGLAEQQKEDQKVEVAVEPKKYRTELYLDTKVSQSDNVYEVASNTKNNGTYSLFANGQVLRNGPVDFGLGARYYLFNAFDLDGFKEETTGIFIPFVFRRDSHRVYAEVSYDTGRLNGTAAYTQIGGSLTYLYFPSDYSVGFIVDHNQKKSEDTTYDYKAGRYQGLRLLATKYWGRFSANVVLGLEDNASNDLDYGRFVLPMANRATKYSARLNYNLSDKSEISLRGLFGEYKYKNTLAVSGVARDDRFANYVLRYTYKWNQLVSTYLSVSTFKNDSSYDDSQDVNKNFTENVTSLGLTVYYF